MIKFPLSKDFAIISSSKKKEGNNKFFFLLYKFLIKQNDF